MLAEWIKTQMSEIRKKDRRPDERELHRQYGLCTKDLIQTIETRFKVQHLLYPEEDVPELTLSDGTTVERTLSNAKAREDWMKRCCTMMRDTIVWQSEEYDHVMVLMEAASEREAGLYGELAALDEALKKALATVEAQTIVIRGLTGR